MISSFIFLAAFTLADEMKLRSIVDVKISPDGQQVAYVVSTPNLETNQHEAELYVIDNVGRASARLVGLKPDLHIFNTPTPRPNLRWSPDGTTSSLLAFAGDRPQVFAIPEALRRLAPQGDEEVRPNGLRLSGERSGAERVRCSRGLGHAAAMTLGGLICMHPYDQSGPYLS
jgi:dipeptidyl aminopeptidase/acylaminoacyl peptidase